MNEWNRSYGGHIVQGTRYLLYFVLIVGRNQITVHGIREAVVGNLTQTKHTANMLEKMHKRTQIASWDCQENAQSVVTLMGVAGNQPVVYHERYNGIADFHKPIFDKIDDIGKQRQLEH